MPGSATVLPGGQRRCHGHHAQRIADWVCGFRWPVQPRRPTGLPPRCGTPNRRDRQNLHTDAPWDRKELRAHLTRSPDFLRRPASGRVAPAMRRAWRGLPLDGVRAADALTAPIVADARRSRVRPQHVGEPGGNPPQRVLVVTHDTDGDENADRFPDLQLPHVYPDPGHAGVQRRLQGNHERRVVEDRQIHAKTLEMARTDGLQGVRFRPGLPRS